jgi:hypothetical protein
MNITVVDNESGTWIAIPVPEGEQYFSCYSDNLKAGKRMIVLVAVSDLSSINTE